MVEIKFEPENNQINMLNNLTLNGALACQKKLNGLDEEA